MIANQSLGVRIRYFRKKKGFTQKELGEAIGVNDSTIRNYELGNRTPDANTMAKIAEALEIDFYTLKSRSIRSTVQFMLYSILKTDTGWSRIRSVIISALYWIRQTAAHTQIELILKYLSSTQHFCHGTKQG